MSNESRPLDQRRTQHGMFTRFRKQCLNAKMRKSWIDANNGNPEFSGLFFVRLKGEANYDVSELYINKKGARFWLTSEPPAHWAEIETYDYYFEDGTPVYDEE